MGFEVSILFGAQRSTQSRGTLMAAPAICPSCMTASGSTIALILGVRMVISGVLLPTTTARTSVGASALWRVSYRCASSGPDSYMSQISFSMISSTVQFTIISSWSNRLHISFPHRQAAAARHSGILTRWQTAVTSLTSRLRCRGRRLGSVASSRGQTC